MSQSQDCPPLAELGFVWYGTLHSERTLPTSSIEVVWKGVWFAKGADQARMDSELLRFKPLWEITAKEYRSGAWRPKGVLGTITAIVLFDQVPRNIFRGTPLAYSSDDIGYELAHQTYGSAGFANLPVHLQYMVIIALVHSEKASDQELVARYASAQPQTLLGDRFRAIATNHSDRISLFGRFPERNAILGRESTAAEAAYMSSIVA